MVVSNIGRIKQKTVLPSVKTAWNVVKTQKMHFWQLSLIVDIDARLQPGPADYTKQLTMSMVASWLLQTLVNTFHKLPQNNRCPT